MLDPIKSILTEIPKHSESQAEFLLLLLSQQVTSSKCREPSHCCHQHCPSSAASSPLCCSQHPSPCPSAAQVAALTPHTQVFTQQPPATWAVTQTEETGVQNQQFLTENPLGASKTPPAVCSKAALRKAVPRTVTPAQLGVLFILRALKIPFGTNSKYYALYHSMAQAI